MVTVLKANTGFAVAIRRASAEARADLRRLDSRATRELELVYEEARLQLQDDILALADASGRLPPAVQPLLLAQVDTVLAELSRAREDLLLSGLTSAAELGVDIWYAAGLPVTTSALVEQAVRQTQAAQPVAGRPLPEGGTDLDRQTRQVVHTALRRCLVLGNRRYRQIAQYRSRQQTPPPEWRVQADWLQAATAAQAVGLALTRGADSPFAEAVQWLRTWLNQAHVAAYRSAMVVYPLVVGERLIVSSVQARSSLRDLCTQMNLYGLGAGVYPIGKAPWPRHPNTLNFIEAVFVGERVVPLAG
jgi:hypothetical protein